MLSAYLFFKMPFDFLSAKKVAAMGKAIVSKAKIARNTIPGVTRIAQN